MTGAELLVRCLEREGVRYVFGVPGEETLHVNEALARSSIQFVPVRHEQAAAFMADVWGRLTGHAGVCLATLGPGATNLATGLADANLDRPPLARAADIINRAEHPLILAGNGVIRGWASKDLTVLAERAQIPVVTTFMAKGAISADHPLARTTVGLASDDPARVGFTSADVVIAVGYDQVEYSAAQWNPSGQLQIVHIDFTAAEVDARYQPAVEVVADVREALELLAPLVAVRPERAPPSRPPDDPRRLDDGFPLLPQRIIWDLESALKPDALVISAVGAHKLWGAKLVRARVPNGVIISNGFAAMGIGLPGAIAAKLAQPERRVVAVTGDAGLLLNIH